jgi:hypothetical protein
LPLREAMRLRVSRCGKEIAMHPQQSQANQSPFDVRSALGWAVVISRIGAVSVEVFLRKGFGARYIGLQALLALLAIPLWGSCFHGDDISQLTIFLESYFVMVVVARIGVGYRLWRGDAIHSYYNGAPRLGRLFPWLSEATLKRFIEPGLVLVLGKFIHETNHPLGSYLLFAAGCLASSAWITDFAMRKRTRDLRDAIIEQQIVMGQFRGSGRW